MARGDPTTYLKIPESLKSELLVAAAAHRRSLTAEIVHRLQGRGLDTFTTEALIQELSRRLGGLTITQP